MGTKRHIAHRVHRLVAEASGGGRVVDLFTGMGSVATQLADFRSVITNDALLFTGSLARARFTGSNRKVTPAEIIGLLKQRYRRHLATLSAEFRTQILREQQATEAGREALFEYMASATHAGNCPRARRSAQEAKTSTGSSHYKLASLYYAAGYFGIRQAIQIDSLRYAIDMTDEIAENRDWLIASWLAAAGRVINSPGHTAQFLKPTSKSIASRIGSFWRRSIWEEFQRSLVDIKQVGSASWRRGNKVEISDALNFLEAPKRRNVGLIYADPPYTKDQYSRYYHVYETLYLYDYPEISGEGRARPSEDRFSTGFSLRSQVKSSFERLFDLVSELEVPLILSYPSQGLLSDAGCTIQKIAEKRMRVTACESFGFEHSTMGAAQGNKTKLATENIYVCHPI